MFPRRLKFTNVFTFLCKNLLILLYYIKITFRKKIPRFQISLFFYLLPHKGSFQWTKRKQRNIISLLKPNLNSTQTPELLLNNKLSLPEGGKFGEEGGGGGRERIVFWIFESDTTIADTTYTAWENDTYVTRLYFKTLL